MDLMHETPSRDSKSNVKRHAVCANHSSSTRMYVEENCQFPKAMTISISTPLSLHWECWSPVTVVDMRGMALCKRYWLERSLLSFKKRCQDRIDFGVAERWRMSAQGVQKPFYLPPYKTLGYGRRSDF